MDYGECSLFDVCRQVGKAANLFCRYRFSLAYWGPAKHSPGAGVVSPHRFWHYSCSNDATRSRTRESPSSGTGVITFLTGRRKFKDCRKHYTKALVSLKRRVPGRRIANKRQSDSANSNYCTQQDWQDFTSGGNIRKHFRVFAPRSPAHCTVLAHEIPSAQEWRQTRDNPDAFGTFNAHGIDVQISAAARSYAGTKNFTEAAAAELYLLQTLSLICPSTTARIKESHEHLRSMQGMQRRIPLRWPRTVTCADVTSDCPCSTRAITMLNSKGYLHAM
nr:hypothetical protein CFP56_00168 [Quercus suber]